MTTRSLYQQLLSRVLPRLTVVMLVVSAVLVILVYAYAQQQANEDQTKTLETVNNSLTQSIAGTQRQMQNLAQNHLLINSFIDFENRQSYLPVPCPQPTSLLRLKIVMGNWLKERLLALKLKKVRCKQQWRILMVLIPPSM